MKKLMFTLALLSAFTGQAQAELKWKKMQVGGGSVNYPVVSGFFKVAGEEYGQLGATELSGGTKQCFTGEQHAVCMMNDGSVKTFGLNNYGQLGDGTTIDKSTPVTIAGFYGAKQCSASLWHTICIMNDGTVKATGNNLGQLGTTTNIGANPNPITINGFYGAKQCSSSGYSTVCIMNDGTVKATGNNRRGQLGTTTNSGKTTAISTTITIAGFNGAKECSIGNGGSHTVCVMNDGSVKVAGWNNYGQLGTTDNSGTNNPNPTPITIAEWQGAKQCSAGSYHTVCIMNDGSVKSAGINNYGQLGTTTNSGTETPNPTPITIAEWQGAKQCSADYSHTVCIRNVPCNSSTDTFAKTSDGTLHVCKNNIWTEL